MSPTLIFAIGAIVFAITVYGTVMAGGLALTRHQVRNNPVLRRKVSERELESEMTTDVSY